MTNSRAAAHGDRVPLTILGGGPAGLGVAFYAHRRGLPFSLFEGSAELGGLCRTFVCGAHRYDAGAHRFHERDAEVTRDVEELLGDELVRVDAPSQICHQGRFIDFPPAPLDWLLGQGIGEAFRVAADLLRARLRLRRERSFEDIATNRYGRRLGKPLLLDYSEKLWGLPASALAPDVATRRLSGFTLRSLFFEVFRPQRKIAHLDGSFRYPRTGYGAICAEMAEQLGDGDLRREHRVVALDCERGRLRAVHFAGRPPVAVAGRILSTLPMSALVALLGDALPEPAHRAAARLRFRHVRLVFLRLDAPRCSENATIYLPDPDLCVSRVSEPKNRSASMAPAHETSLVAEVPCSAGDPVASLGEAALAERVIAELARVGLVEPRRVLAWRHHFLPNAYPVYALDYPGAVRCIREALTSIENLDVLGRNGLFWYSHLHDQLRLAKDYVASLASAQRPAENAAEVFLTHPEVGEEAVVATAAT